MAEESEQIISDLFALPIHRTVILGGQRGQRILDDQATSIYTCEFLGSSNSSVTSTFAVVAMTCIKKEVLSEAESRWDKRRIVLCFGLI